MSSPRFGICTDQNLSWPVNVERWRYFEQLGYDSLWLCDHLIQPSRPDGPYFEGWTLLAALATQTERARIGILVSSNTFRHPALLAREAVTVDHISNGRLELGLGAGWYVPEHTMFGIDFPETRELVDRFREAVELLDRYLRVDTSSYEGRYYQLHEATNRPAPLQQPRPPLVLGAKGPRMLQIDRGTLRRHLERLWDCGRDGRAQQDPRRSLRAHRPRPEHDRPFALRLGGYHARRSLGLA